MFPLSDIIPSRTRPVITIGIIALNALVFLYQLQLDDGASRRFVFEFGLIPAFVSGSDVVSSMFLHADLLHFLGNMVMLWIFGDNVEDRLGHAAYLVFYLAAGAVAAAAQVAAAPLSIMPMVGASGAIAGVLGAYFVLYPRSRILTAVFIVFFLDVIEIPAIFLLGAWFLLQLAHGALTDGANAGIAFWAHAGGFAAGAATGVALRVRDGRSQFYWRREPRA